MIFCTLNYDKQVNKNIKNGKVVGLKLEKSKVLNKRVLANWCGKKSYKSTLKVPEELLSGRELIYTIYKNVQRKIAESQALDYKTATIYLNPTISYTYRLLPI